jgi:hypothetical protein
MMKASSPSDRTHVDELLSALHACAAEAGEGQLKLARLFERLGDASFGFICFVHTLPFLQPLSLGPISTAAGASLMALGTQMAQGRATPWMPERMNRLSLSGKFWRILITTAEKALSAGRRITRPRLPGLVRGVRARQLGGAIIAVSGLLLAVPLAGVPFSNTLPALAVLLVCLGELEEDGLMVLLALVMVVLTVAYFGLLGWLIYTLGDQAWDWFRR